MAAPQIPEEAIIPVKMGTCDTVKAVPGQYDALLIDKGQKNLISTKVELLPEVAAPVSKGQRLGTLSICAGEQVLAQIPLVAEQAVERLTFGQLFLRVLRQICMAEV